MQEFYLTIAFFLPKIPIYDFQNNEQQKYIFSDKPAFYSGCVIIFQLHPKTENPIIIFVYFDNLSANITSIAFFRGTINMPLFDEFIYRLVGNGIINKLPNEKLNIKLALLNSQRFITILIPKNYNRHWIQMKYLNYNILFKSYLWKDQSIPKVIKDLHKYINNTIKAGKLPKTFDEIINNFNDKVKQKLENLANTSSQTPTSHVENVKSTDDKGLNSQSTPRLNISDTHKTVTLAPHTTKRNYSIATNSLNLNNLPEPRVFKVKYDWEYYVLDLESFILFNKFIEYFINLFLAYINTHRNVNPNLIISIQLKVEFDDGSVKSISDMFTQPIKNLDTIIHIILQQWSSREEYHTFVCNTLMIFFKIRSADYPIKPIRPSDYKQKPTFSYRGYTLPATMNIQEWGQVKYNNDKIFATVKIFQSKLTASIQISDNQNNVTILSDYKKIYNFVDFRIDGDNTFKRIFPNYTVYFKNGKNVLLLNVKKTKFIKKINKQTKMAKLNIITMDLETRKINGRLYPVIISVYDGKIKKSFCIWEYKNGEEMLRSAFQSIMIRKYYRYKVFFHNFSYFDGIFILKVLTSLDVVINPIIRDSKLLKIVVQYDKNGKIYKGSFTIMDSLLILSVSLGKLAQVFNCDQKLLFPLKILNDNIMNNFEYKGLIPTIEYFYHPHPIKHPNEYNKFLIDLEKYNSSMITANKEWSVKENLIKYCEQDVTTLNQVLIKFSVEIFNKYGINIFRYPTLPSIAFAMYRSNFMQIENIPIITGEMYNDISNAYYGGFVDVYIPYARCVKGFDVNSLYSESMENKPMPVGSPTFFNGDITSIIPFNQIFGYIYVTVETPRNLDKPILPLRITLKSGVTTTIYPIGSWSSWYFSEEVKNAVDNFDYKVKIHKGYIFKKDYIFKSYVNTLYDIKVKVDKNDPWYTISKLLLNSLSGRFGMNPELELYKLTTLEEFDKKYERKFQIKSTLDFDEKILFSYVDPKNEEKDSNTEINVSVSISAAITSWSRIHMTKFIKQYGPFLCYIDTDGLKSLVKFSDSQIGKGLGKMKFEGEYIEGVFISPKVYGGINANYKEDVKVKGLKSYVSFAQLKSLLYGGFKEFSQEKWIRDFSKGTITIVDQIYTLSVTENKRELIKDSCGIIVGTRPYLVKDGVIVDREPFILYYLPSPSYNTLKAIESGVKYLYFPLPKDTPILLPNSLDDVIYLPPPLAPIIYAPGPYIKLLSPPKTMIQLVKPISLLQLSSGPTQTPENIIYLPLPLPEIIYILPSLPQVSIVYASGPFIPLIAPPTPLLALPLPTPLLAISEPGAPKRIIYLPGAIDSWHAWY